MKEVQPRFPISHRTTNARACMRIYSNEVDVLRKAFVRQLVCVTIDTWTFIQNLNYMVVIAHFNDCDWTYQKKNLELLPYS